MITISLVGGRGIGPLLALAVVLLVGVLLIGRDQIRSAPRRLEPVRVAWQASAAPLNDGGARAAAGTFFTGGGAPTPTPARQPERVLAAVPTPAGSDRVAQEPTAAASTPAASPTPARGFGRRPRPTPPPLPLWIALAGVVGVVTTLALVYWGRRNRQE